MPLCDKNTRQMLRRRLTFSPLSRSPTALLRCFSSMEDPNFPTAAAAAAGAGADRSSPIPTSYLADSSPSSAPSSQPPSAPGSLKADASASLLEGADAPNAAEHGFQRPEMGQLPLAGTVGLYERHVFLCYKSPDVWPSHVEASEFDRLPRLLSAAVAARKGVMKKKTRLTICGGEDGTDSSNGDILIFPDMIRYRRLTHFDVDNFVEEVLVKNTEWVPGGVEKLTGSYVFVCAHGSRDKRCGVCGPALITKFEEEIRSHGLQDKVFVSPCSHIGGHKYAGNVIFFSSHLNGEVTGHWYGYVAPDDVPLLLEQHIGKGEIVDHLWRGQMGLSGEDQKQAQDRRFQLNGEASKTAENSIQTSEVNGVNGVSSCCQGVGNTSCCQNMPLKGKLDNNHADIETREIAQDDIENKASYTKESSTRKICRMPTWFECWEREDTYAALAVVSAIASVAVAYSCYRQLK